MKVYQQVAAWAGAYKTASNREIADNYPEWIGKLVKGFLPSGSGIDNGVVIDLDKSDGYKLVFTSSFHKMSESGFYCGWWDFKVTVRPSLITDFDLKITSSQKDTQMLRDYLLDIFAHSLSQEIPEEFMEKFREEVRAHFKDGA